MVALTLIYPAKTNRLPENTYADFWHALATEEEATFLLASNQGLLDTCLPEWRRLRSTHNTQHATHDFLLDVHTAKVLTKTRKSPYFATLPPQWQELTTLAALLHDISKEGGLAEQRFTLKPDMAHPAKGVAVVRKRLPAWGFSQQAVEWASLLVAHHQAFGRWIMRAEFQKKDPTPLEVTMLAEMLRSVVLLQALQALTEGDIRGVKGGDKLFTPFAEERLATYAAMVQEAIVPIEAQHKGRLEGLLSHLGANHAASCLFTEDMKTTTTDLLPKPALLPQTLVATLPVAFLADADASPCALCELKNQASSRVFPVQLQRVETLTAEVVRVGVLRNQLLAFEKTGENMFLLQVQNPVLIP